MRTVVDGLHVQVFGPDGRLLYDSATRRAPQRRVHPLLLAAAAERERQFTVEGYDTAHDDKHTDGQLARAAAAYAWPANVHRAAGPSLHPHDSGHDLMPFGWVLKRGPMTVDGRKRELEKAVALLCSEWDRLERLERET